MFHDRIEAGMVLAKALEKYRDEPGVVLAIPRGGVPVAYVVAKELGWPMDLLLTRKIGHPLNREYAIGAVSLTEQWVVPHEFVTQAYIDKETERIRGKLREMYQQFMGNKPPQDLEDKTVIVIDDGVATGNTLISAVNMLRKSRPAKIVIAVPVASSRAYEKLAALADDIICPFIPRYFPGVGAFYKQFEQVNDKDVMYCLDKLGEMKSTG